MIRRLACALLLVVVATGCASFPHRSPLRRSRQLIVVTAPGESSTTATMRRYEREADAWREVGEAVPVVIGRTGLEADKREGDGKSPAGLFRLGRAFGFDAAAPTRMPYLPLRATTECVDDVLSKHYNAIVERDAVEVDWKSSEKMRAIDVYRWGIVVLYNEERTPGRGSCIFIHLVSESQKPTAGCTAMSADALSDLLAWLDPAAQPLLAQYTEEEYARLREKLGLP